MRSFKELEFGYWSIILDDQWLYIDPKGNIINSATGHWEESIFVFDRGSKLDLNHVFVK